MLAPAYRWADSKDDSRLFLRYGWVASVVREGAGFQVKMKDWKGKDIGGPCASLAQGKRFVERWVEGCSKPKRRKRPTVLPRKPDLLSRLGRTPDRPSVQLPADAYYPPEAGRDSDTLLNEVFESL